MARIRLEETRSGVFVVKRGDRPIFGPTTDRGHAEHVYSKALSEGDGPPADVGDVQNNGQSELVRYLLSQKGWGWALRDCTCLTQMRAHRPGAGEISLDIHTNGPGTAPRLQVYLKAGVIAPMLDLEEWGGGYPTPEEALAHIKGRS